jgi:hypothetical protein
MPITKGNRRNWRRVRGSFTKDEIPWGVYKHNDVDSHEEEEYNDLSFL